MVILIYLKHVASVTQNIIEYGLPGIEVIFAIKDRPLVLIMVTYIYVWTLFDESLKNYVFNAINGKLRTGKINSFYSLIDWLVLKGVKLDKL